VELFDSEKLLPITKVSRGTRVALAVLDGKVRLIYDAKL
jgi:hypothetical protein